MTAPVSVAAVLNIIISFLSSYLETPPLPNVDLDEWWGPEHLQQYQDTSVKPFRIEFNDSMITDLRNRIRNTRPLTPPLKGSASEYGFNTNQMDSWLKYWADEYPFQEREKEINKYPQYRTNIQGLEVHFVRVRPKVPPGVTVVPLLLLHGWPTSFLDFYEIIPTLTAYNGNRDFAIEVIAASLPGFVYSDGAVRPGFGVDKMAVVLRNLMQRLGFRQYYIHGADWGSVVCKNMATFFPNEVLGYHTSMPTNSSPMATIIWLIGAIYPHLVVRPEVADRIYPVEAVIEKMYRELGYFHLQATKPDTVDVALTDSPAGLLAYYLEKISVGTRPDNRYLEDGGLLNHFTREQLIDNIMLYWISNSVATAGRIYKESTGSRYYSLKVDNIPSPVLTWITQAKYEIWYTPPWIFRLKFPNLLHETVLAYGGHFLALEMPYVLAEDILNAMTEFRRVNGLPRMRSENQCHSIPCKDGFNPMLDSLYCYNQFDLK